MRCGARFLWSSHGVDARRRFNAPEMSDSAMDEMKNAHRFRVSFPLCAMRQQQQHHHLRYVIRVPRVRESTEENAAMMTGGGGEKSAKMSFISTSDIRTPSNRVSTLLCVENMEYVRGVRFGSSIYSGRCGWAGRCGSRPRARSRRMQCRAQEANKGRI